MTYEQYWYGDVWMIADYRESNKLNRQRKSEEMWMQGLYNFKAVSTAISNAFRKKGTKAHAYLEQPIRIIPYSEEEKADMAEQEQQKNIDQFRLMMERWERENKTNK